MLRLVVFVVDVADNLFENIFKRHHALCAAEFVDHYGHMQLELAEILQKIVDHARFRHEICLAEQILPAEIGRCLFADIGEQVA